MRTLGNGFPLWESIDLPILDVGKKMANDFRRDDIPQRFALLLSLKGNAGDFPVSEIQDGASAIARVYGCVNLDAKQLRPSMGISYVLNSRDDAASVRNVVPANRIADRQHIVLHMGSPA